MKYSRKLLENLSWGTEEHQNITQELINRLCQGEKLTWAEAEYICSFIRLLHSDDPDFKKIEPQDYPACNEFCFKNRYIMYFQDLEGWGRIDDVNGPVSSEQKRKDVALLEKCHQEWKSIIQNNWQPNELLKNLSSETHHQIKEIERYCKRQFIGYFREEYLKKSLILHSKYIFGIVSEFYEELGKTEEKIELCGKTINIDSFFYIHTLFRHYSKFVKEHQLNKTYHFDENIKFKEIPNLILEILADYKNNVNCHFFNERNIDFELRGYPYSLWFRPITKYKRGNIKESELRVQTFYPIAMPTDFNRINKMEKLHVTTDLVFFVDNH